MDIITLDPKTSLIPKIICFFRKSNAFFGKKTLCVKDLLFLLKNTFKFLERRPFFNHSFARKNLSAVA